MLQIEEEYVQRLCEDIIRFKPDVVFTEKGVSGMLTALLNMGTARKEGNRRGGKQAGPEMLKKEQSLAGIHKICDKTHTLLGK